MGCTTSKPLVDTTDDVLRNCKVRRSHIREAIKHRKDFANAHAAYIHSLKDVGSALRHFAQGELVDADLSPGSPSTLVLALPPPLSPSIGGLSPLPHSSSSATALSPPPSGSRYTVNGKAPTSLPLTVPISPPLSPIRLPTSNHLSSTRLTTSDDLPSPIESHPASLHTTDGSLRSRSLNNMASPDRGSEFSPPYYSPSRDDLDDALVAYSPPPPSSLIADSAWFNLDIFTPPPIPEHLQEQRRMKRAGDLEQEDMQGAVEVDENEGIPDLEEAEHNEDEVAHDKKDSLLKETMPEEVVKKVVLEEMVDASELKANDDKPVIDSLEEDPSVAPVQPEVVVSAGIGNEKLKKEPVPVIILKERNVSEAMRHIDDLFARAFQCGQDVSRMLETQIHHPSRGNHTKDSSKVFNAITSHWSKKIPLVRGDANEDDDLLECGMSGSHASTLERLQAWERKLYEEVKEGKLLRTTFDLKFKRLHYLEAKGGDPIAGDKLKATLKKLDMRLMVAIRAIRAASMRIQLLTNEELYPQLCEMLGGLVTMWRMMSECHQIQVAIALQMQTFEDSIADIEATEAHKRATVKLKDELEKLQTHFQGWMRSQKKYIVELEEWIKKCYETIEPSNEPIKIGKKVSSEATEKAPIFYLLKAWRHLPGDLDGQQKVVNSIQSFVSVMFSLEENQCNEIKLKRQAEKSTKRLDQQTLSLNKLERQYTENGNDSLTVRSSRLSRLPSTSKLEGRRVRLDKYKSQVETEKHEHLAAVQARKNVTLELLKQQLLTLFQSLTTFADNAQKMYENVKERAEAGDKLEKQSGAARLGWKEQH